MILMKYFIAIFFVFLFAKSSALRSFDIRWRHLTCTIMAKAYFGFFNCTLGDFPRNRGNYATVHIQFKQDIHKVLLEFRVTMPNSGNNDMDLIKFRSDGCHITKYKSANPVVTAMAKQLFQSANFPASCPLKANVTYNVRNFSLNPDFFPGYTPEMNFTIRVSMFTRKVRLLDASIVASIIKKK